MSDVVNFGSGAEATPGKPSFSNIFQQGGSFGLTTKMPTKSPEVFDALQQANQLVRDYETLKTEVFLRADRASWLFLSSVYDYVLRINKSVKKRQIKSDLIEMIKTRDRISITTASETETLVVRYVFSDVTRQSRNNYVGVIQKALAMDVEEGELVGLLEQSGGIINWVNKAFEGTTEGTIDIKDQRKIQRTDAVNLMRRLFALMANAQDVSTVTTTKVTDWTPSAQQLAALKDSKKTAPKNQPGDFVFFVAVPGATPGEYNLLQGFSPTRDFEDQFLLQIAGRLGVSNEQLQVFISQIESSLPN